MDYTLIRGREGTQRQGALRTILVGGERALPVFASPEAAEDYLLLGGHGPEWEVAAGARESLLGLLRKHAPRLGVRTVVLDPPASLRGGKAPAVAPVPIEEFLDQLEAADE